MHVGNKRIALVPCQARFYGLAPAVIPARFQPESRRNALDSGSSLRFARNDETTKTRKNKIDGPLGLSLRNKRMKDLTTGDMVEIYMEDAEPVHVKKKTQ